MRTWSQQYSYIVKAWSDCKDVQAGLALYWWQRLISFGVGRVRVNFIHSFIHSFPSFLKESKVLEGFESHSGEGQYWLRTICPKPLWVQTPQGTLDYFMLWGSIPFFLSYSFFVSFLYLSSINIFNHEYFCKIV